MQLKDFANKKICVAISGGADSTALLHYLKSEQDKYAYSLCAVHCEHGIRGEDSLKDMDFVKEFCARLGVELFIERENCLAKAKEEKISVETAARNFRKQAFEKIIANNKADYIATAHHLDDEAETVLFRIARGSSLSGARGMGEVDGYIIRPFLGWTKEDVLRYVQENNLPFCTDESNFQTQYTRNKLRLDVLPVLESAVPSAKENLVRFSRLAGEDDAFLYAESEKLLTRTEKGILIGFNNHKPLFRRACLTAMKLLGVEKDYTALHLESVYRLQESERGAKINLPKDVIAEKRAKGIFLSIAKSKMPIPKPTLETPFSVDGFDGGKYLVICKENVDAEGTEGVVLRVDKEKLPKDAVYRFRKEGDTFCKFGGGRKSLKKFFNEKQIPVEERAYLPLIAKQDGREVYVVCGVEIADSVKVDENTKEILYICIQKK